MSKVLSRWKLTLSPAASPLVILTYNELLDSELEIMLVKGLEVVQLTDADFPFLRSTKNAYYQLGFTVSRAAASDDDARVAMLSYLTDTMDTRGKQILRIEIQGRPDVYYDFASACTTEFKCVRDMDSGRARNLFTFQITAAGLAKVVVP